MFRRSYNASGHVGTGHVGFNPDPAIVDAGFVREGGRGRAVEALTIVRS